MKKIIGCGTIFSAIAVMDRKLPNRGEEDLKNGMSRERINNKY